MGKGRGRVWKGSGTEGYGAAGGVGTGREGRVVS